MKYKNELMTIILVTISVFLLKLSSILKVGSMFNNSFHMILIIIFISLFIIYIQNRINKNYENKNINHSNIDLLKFITSLIIIVNHLRPFLNSCEFLDIFFNNIISRICVLFYLLTTGYLISIKEKEKKDYIKNYLKSVIKLYLVWSIIYLPISICFIFKNIDLINTYLSNYHLTVQMILPYSIILLPLIIIFSLIYTGIYYHLWYFPALIISVFILKKWKEKFSVLSLLIISFILLIIGATETYYGILPDFIKDILSYYYNTFFTTRNFLFFGLFYVVLGYMIGKKKNIYSHNCFGKLFLATCLLIIEGIYIHSIDRLNSNILLSSVLFVYYLFISFLYIDCKPKNKAYRNLSKYYYLIHPAIILGLSFITTCQSNYLLNSFLILIITIIITHILAIIIIKLKEKYPKLII